jgi:ferrous iron transport protein B
LTTLVVAPIQDAFAQFIHGPVTDGVVGLLGALGVTGGWFEALLTGGVLEGVAVVCEFLPLMAVIFAILGVLEDSGYMARVAVMGDRLMRGSGLDGRSVVPLVLGFGCNVPALAATKTVPHARQRLLTALLVPLTSCNARLVIFMMIAQACFPGRAGLVVWAMYLISVVLIVLLGRLLRGVTGATAKGQGIVMVLPPYQLPRAGFLLSMVGRRCLEFASRAGRLIVALSIATWLLMAIPVSGGHQFGNEVPPSDSALGAVSQVVGKAMTPAGLDDWHIGAAAITGFAAKEAVVSTLATTYGLDPEAEDQTDLGQQLQATLSRTSGGHPGLAAFAFLVFCLVYTPCLVTVAEQRRHIGGRLTALAVTSTLTLAWLLAVAIFQIGRLFG